MSNGTKVYHFRRGSSSERVQPGNGKVLTWDVLLESGKKVPVRSGDALPKDTHEYFWFVVPAEKIASDKLTWTLTNWGECKDLISLHMRLPRSVNERHRSDLAKKLAHYDYNELYSRYYTSADKQWSRVMGELLTMHVLNYVLNDEPILLIRDMPKPGDETISPCMYIQARPVFGPARP